MGDEEADATAAVANEQLANRYLIYPIQIELFQRKRKTEQPPTRISLAWIPPKGTEEVIPERHLLPEIGVARRVA